jgi:hypothetical protein
MMLHALSKVTNGSVTGDDARDVDTAPAVGPQAAGIGGRTVGDAAERLGPAFSHGLAGVGATAPRHAPKSREAARTCGIRRRNVEGRTVSGEGWSATLDEYD